MWCGHFLEVWGEMVSPKRVSGLCTIYAPVPRKPPKMTVPQLLSAHIYHVLQEGGTLASSGKRLHGIDMSDQAYAERRESLPIRLFDELMFYGLKPLADPRRHKECFYKGWRLAGLDGTQWSATNTPMILAQLPKAASRRLKAAFAKIRLVCAVELGTHAPIAAVAAPATEGEQTLARRVWDLFPEHVLVIEDRLFGTARTLDEAITGSEGRDIAFLVRVKNNIKVKVLSRLPDGSAIVQVPVRENGKSIGQLKVREIRAKGIGRDGQKFGLRLWTTLLDQEAYPAAELAELYAMRWECELYYKELKYDVRGAPVLASHTLETALQETAALVLASAVVARMRVEAATRLRVPVVRVSFHKLLVATRGLWSAFKYAGSKLTEALKAQFWKEYVDDVRSNAILPERRHRSSPRVLCQPVNSWPRKTDQKSYSGDVKIAVIPL